MSDNTTLIDNLNSIKNSKADIKQALIDKGQQATDVLATYADLIEDIETGIDTSDATATASDIKEGKTAYVDGEKITGIYVDEDLTDVLDAQDQKIAELEQSLENKTAGSTSLIVNSGSVVGTTLYLSSEPKLPYTELEYIESTGTQYIDIGYIPNADTKFEIKFSDIATNESVLLASVWSTTGYCLSTSSGNIYWHYSSGKNLGSYSGTNVLNIYRNVVVLNDTVVLNDSSSNGKTYNSSLKIFGFNDGYRTKGKFYYLKIWENSILKYDFITIKDKQNVICLYDKVSETYLYNAGTGDFIAGPEKN